MDAVKTRLTVEEFIAQYPDHTRQIIEFIDGEVVIMPPPKDLHQYISFRLALLIGNLVLSQNLGEVRTAPSLVRMGDQLPEPDIFYVSKDNTSCVVAKDGYWQGAPDLCVEIISPGSGKHDRVTKFGIYQAHGVREYWIVDAEERFIEVWTLAGNQFQLHGKYAEGNQFTSTVLPALTITVSEIFPTA